MKGLFDSFCEALEFHPEFLKLSTPLCSKITLITVKAPFTLRRRNLKTVYTSPSRKGSFSKALFKPAKFENAGFAF